MTIMVSLVGGKIEDGLTASHLARANHGWYGNAADLTQTRMLRDEFTPSFVDIYNPLT